LLSFVRVMNIAPTQKKKKKKAGHSLRGFLCDGSDTNDA